MNPFQVTYLNIAIKVWYFIYLIASTSPVIYATVVVEGKYRDVRFSCRIHFYHLCYRNALLIVLTTCNQTLFPLKKIESTCFLPSKFSFSLLQSPSRQGMQCQSIRNGLKNLNDVLFQERRTLFQEIMLSYCLRCQESSQAVQEYSHHSKIGSFFNEFQLRPKFRVYSNEIQFCKCLF